MLTEQTIQRLQELKLTTMAASFVERQSRPDHKDLSFAEFFGLLVDDEYLSRQNKKLKLLLQYARLKIGTACLENLSYEASRGLTKTRILNLQNTSWLDKHQNILITGPTGVGKTYLACAFGQWACRNGYSTLYYRWPRLLGDVLAAKGEGNYLKYLRKLAKCQCLIIDDFAISPLTDNDRKDLLEIIEDRHLTTSTIIASQLPSKNWHEYIGDATIADAVCDRLFSLAHKFELKGASLRERQQAE